MADGGEGPGAAWPPPRQPWAAAAEEKGQGCWLATLDTPRGAHGPVPFTIQPNLCDPGDAGDSARSPVPPTLPGLRAQLCNQTLPGLSQAQAGAPRQESSALACWPVPPAFWDPSPPSQGSRTSVSVCRATGGEPAATGWTVFVNLLETSQYSPELHLLHALKLTVQATRMTLTDLAQYHVF